MKKKQKNNFRCVCGRLKSDHPGGSLFELDVDENGDAVWHQCMQFKLDNLSYLEAKYNEENKI